MSNLTEEEYNDLKESQLKEIIEFYDFQEEWDNNPMNILLKKQIDLIGEEINSLIKEWPEIDE